jgi:hypothetical protein
MPLTFPSHAAAILPFTRIKRLPPAALIVGTMGPDFAYLFGIRLNFHVLPWVLVPCVPIAIGMWITLEAALLPMLRRTLPVARGVEWGRLATTRGLPVDARGWLDALLALGIGIATHVLWDGFTHQLRWPARDWYAHVKLAGVELTFLLQCASTVVGAVLVGIAAKRAYAALPRVQPTGALRFSHLVLLAGIALFIAQMLFEAVGGFEGPRVFHALWHWFWFSARAVMLSLLVACALEWMRVRNRGVQRGV